MTPSWSAHELELSRADDQRLAALMSADVQRLTQFLHPDLVYVHANGQVDTQATYLGRVASHDLRYSGYELHSRSFNDSGSVSVGRGELTWHLPSLAEPVALGIRFLSTWIHDGGRWRLLAWMSASGHPR